MKGDRSSLAPPYLTYPPPPPPLPLPRQHLLFPHLMLKPSPWTKFQLGPQATEGATDEANNSLVLSDHFVRSSCL